MRDNDRFFSRRRALLMIAMIAPFAGMSRHAFAASAASTAAAQDALEKLERSANGRLGIVAFDTGNGKSVEYRPGERFPFCSTFKTIAAAAILKRSEEQRELLGKRIGYTKQDTDASGYAPITGKLVGKGMTVSELCAATLQYSDNAAVNLLMKELGGTAAVTAFARTVGDETFRLDRWEPELNSAVPGDLRDTTTPAAMVQTLQKLMLGNALGSLQREQLVFWMKKNRTGDARIRAGVPTDWIVADKTGTGSYGTTNDIGVLWPPGRAPIVVVLYFTQHEQAAKPRDDVIADATRTIVRFLA
ncbi:MAG TPA: class A beta-lactamase [Oxalicibacterium sp.]|nr:class A beta-lactamase [Oxalicibacterium sp.]